MKAHDGIRLATAVINLLPERFATATMEGYCNGREQGYAVVPTRSKVKFIVANDRDDAAQIVVYTGGKTQADFNPQNIPNDMIFAARKKFVDVQSAANYVASMVE